MTKSNNNKLNTKKSCMINHYIIIILLTTILFISVSFAWYTSNKEVSTNTITANVEVPLDLKVEKAQIFRREYAVMDEDNTLARPYPTDTLLIEDEITDLLPGEIFYLSFSLTGDDSIRNINMKFRDIKGDALSDSEGNIFFKKYDDVISDTDFYTMCDVYKVDLDSIWFSTTVDDNKSYNKQDIDTLISNGNISETNKDTKYFNGGQYLLDSETQSNSKQHIDSYDILNYIKWDSSNEISFTFKITFDFSLINDNRVFNSYTSNKYFTFDSIVVIAEEVK